MNNLLKVTDLTVDFIAISKNGKIDHRHQISNFNPLVTVHTTTNTTANGSIKLPFFNVFTPDGNSYILGTVEVGINGKKYGRM
jgi:hypothetical protein